MKKTILFVLFTVSLSVVSFCQPTDLPNNATIPHLKLSVGYNVSTILIFSSAIIQADRGERDLMIQKQPGIENVLKVKAARKGFSATNLHVFTTDGNVYAFDVIYAANPEQT